MKLLFVSSPSHRILRDAFMLPSLQDDYELVHYECEESGEGSFLQRDWTRSVRFKCERIIETILDNPGEVFVYADVDLRFFAPTRQHLLRAIEHHDIACQLDDPKGTLCTGFFVARANPHTRDLWEGVRQCIPRERRDQLAFNRLARRRIGLRARSLPVRFFGAGTFTGRQADGHSTVYIPPSPLMFHANWCVGVDNKKALLARVGQAVEGGLPAITRNNERHVTRSGHNRHSSLHLHAVAHDSTPPQATRACLDLSSACQLACPACPTAQGQVRRHLGAGMLALADFRRFLDLHPKIGHIELSNWGELFLNRDLAAILRLARERGVSLSADNGVNLNSADAEMLEAVVKYGLRSLTCSIDGATQTTYGRYRVRGDFERVMAHIREINRHKQRYATDYPRLRWQYVAFGHNQREIVAARDMARELNMGFYLKLSWGDLYTAPFSPVTDHELIRRESGLGVADREEYRSLHGHDYTAQACRQLWQMPRIHSDGRLLGCSVNYWADFGNVFERGLDACLRGERMQRARAAVSGLAEAGDDVPCASCNVYARMRETGVWMGADGPISGGSATGRPAKP